MNKEKELEFIIVIVRIIVLLTPLTIQNIFVIASSTNTYSERCSLGWSP